jgi:3-isopropylmalate/(R)-2-methylmalate dehydratase small subunit
MDPFRTVTGVAAPLLRDNVDTDALLPKQFLTTISRAGLGTHLFHDLRYDDGGAERPDFILNEGVYRQASFLVCGANFGCGSSREHAPWALADFGIRAVLAVSFADIFSGNCTKNGIVPVVLPEAAVARLAAAVAVEPELTVDLEARTVAHRTAGALSFELPDFARDMLLRGLDDIGWTDERQDRIAAFEERQRASEGWLWPQPAFACTVDPSRR